MQAGGTPHALVVGGTGMLAGASLALAGQGYQVSVVARRVGRIRQLARAAGVPAGCLNPLALDYHDVKALSAGLCQAAASAGPFVLVVSWIHGSAVEAPLAVARAVSGGSVPCRFFDVLGSSAMDPSRLGADRGARFRVLPNLAYHEVILGFVREPSGSRWLTHDEICAGVLTAIDQDAWRFVVGTVRPWSARP